LQGVGDGFFGFFSRFLVARQGFSVFYLDGESGVEAYEGELCQFFWSFNGFQQVGCCVLFVEFGEDFKGRFFETDFLKI
jgi:hypothetical protein